MERMERQQRPLHMVRPKAMPSNDFNTSVEEFSHFFIVQSHIKELFLSQTKHLEYVAFRIVPFSWLLFL